MQLNKTTSHKTNPYKVRFADLVTGSEKKGGYTQKMRTTVSGVAKSLAPISQGTPLANGLSAGKDNLTRQRKMRIFTELEDSCVLQDIPIVSGNSLRGVGRRMLINETFKALDIDWESMFPRRETQDAVKFFFTHGGLSPKGLSPKGVKINIYTELRKVLPFLDLLGGVYYAHHFEGACRIGNMVPLTKETFEMLKADLPPAIEIKKEKLPKIRELLITEENDPMTTSVQRFIKKRSEEKKEEKEAGMFNVETITVGTTFRFYATAGSDNENTLKAFRAMMFLLQDRGYVGGMSAKGLGRVAYDLYCQDEKGTTRLNSKDLTDYLAILKETRQKILEALKSIPGTLVSVKSKEEKKSRAADSGKKNDTKTQKATKEK